eukprot:Nitzschia sp. Nitz4//scaffold122_size67431//57983//60126//NITZ4_006096-RA/size67431-processed-gene-0.49-mRNA-1//-1//CDS//3329534436//4606//frame0
MQTEPKRLVVVIAGPTAAGKSDVAAKICSSLKGLIISADSVQAYRGVQIGANKPTEAERQETPHMLIDVADHSESYNAADWMRDTISCIEDMHQIRNETDTNPRLVPLRSELEAARKLKGYSSGETILPVVCGGTMMYIQWLVHGQPDAMRPSEEAVSRAREIMTKFEEAKDYGGAVEYVGSLGKVFTERVTTKFSGEDWYRLRRTLEVALTVQEQDNKAELIENLYNGERQGSLSSMGYDVRCFFLCPNDRMAHTRIVDERCEQMLLRGLLKETTDLSLSGSMPMMATKAIGYRQTLDYLYAEPPVDEEEAFQLYLNDFTTATRRYAKQQMAWFRKDKDFMFIPVAVEESKARRVEDAATAILRYCQMPRVDYESDLNSPESVSAVAKETNVEQGKGMKFYQFERHVLKPGTEELKKSVKEAADCRQRIQDGPTQLPQYFPVEPKGCEKQAQSLFECLANEATNKAREMERAGVYQPYFSDVKARALDKKAAEAVAEDPSNPAFPKAGDNPLDECRNLVAHYKQCCDRKLKQKRNWILTEHVRVQEEYRYKGPGAAEE